MEEARVLISTSWQQRLQNNNYKNWLKVGYGIDLVCKAIRPYVEKEAKTFHGLLTTRLRGTPLCSCTYTRYPYHDTIRCLWAKELLNYHAKGKPTWNQSDASLWNDPIVGHWEVAKVYMPYGCAKGNSCAETDATGLLNLLLWCSYYKTNRTLVEKFKDTRNEWGHAPKHELDAAQTIDAFVSMKNFLQDAELIGDADATDALTEIISLENDDLIDFEDLETKVVKELKQSMTSMKDELVAKFDSMKDQEDIHANEIKDQIANVKSMVSYCMKFGQETEDVLLNITGVLCDMQDQIEKVQSKMNSRNEIQEVRSTKGITLHLILWAIAILLKGLNTFPRKVTLLIIFLAVIPTLDENLDEIGCCARPQPEGAHELMERVFFQNLNRAREGFVGRHWLFRDISHSLENEQFKGVMVVAAPGFGKSALMSNLICSKLSNYSLHSQILGYHLCMNLFELTRNGAIFVRNLAGMIAERLQDYKNLAAKDRFIQRVLNSEQCSSDPTACFQQTILSPLSKLQLSFLEPTMYIVIDALDECYNENDLDKGSSIVNILSNSIIMFPNWLKVIVTSRNVTDIRRKFSSLDVLDFFPEDPRNLQDIERFIFSQLRQSFLSQLKSIFVDDLSIQAMINKSQGNFLYIKHVLDYVKTKGASAATWNSLPTSINSIYQEFFERKFNTKEKFRGPRKIFEILVATLSPLTTEELYDTFVTSLPKETEIFDFEYDFLFMLEDLSMYLSSIQENQIVTVFHSSLTEWLTSSSNRGGRFYVDVKKGNQLLADYYFKKMHEKSLNITPQFVYHLATYIVRGSSIKRHVYEFTKLDRKMVRVSDTRTNSTALHIAAGEENEKTVALLLNFFENVDIEDNKGRTPAFYASRFDRIANLRLLYQRGASLAHMTSTLNCDNPNAEEDVQYCEHQMSGYSSLHVASQRGHHQTVKFLLMNNVSVSPLSGSGFSALHLAVKYNHSETMQALLEHGAVPDGRCLYYAALHGSSQDVRLLLENGAEDTCMNCTEMSNGYLNGQFQFSNLEDHQNYRQDCNTALHIAAIKNLTNIANLLIKSNKKAVHCVNFYGKNPLLEAVDKSHFQVTKLLLKAGANSSSVCHYYPILDSLPLSCPCGYTPLHIAARRGDAVITKLLLRSKADFDARDCEGLQPIHVASCHGNADVLSILVKKGADINSKGPNDTTPIHYACKCQNDGIFDKLFELGANGTALTSDGKTPVHYIIQEQSIDEEFYLMDPYVTIPIEPIDTTHRNAIESPFKDKYPWMVSVIRFLTSFAKGKSYDLESMGRLDLMSVFIDPMILNVSISMLGSEEASNWKYIALTSPLYYAYDIGILSHWQKFKDELDSKSEFIRLLFKAITHIDTNCTFLQHTAEKNLIYFFGSLLSIGYDVNCNDSETSGPLFIYLRQGGRNMAKVLVKHRVTIDIRCGEFFEDSAFHLAAYHKLHYLQYISVFRDHDKWEEYLKQENALFDYLFDEYDKKTVGDQVKVVRVRDGPVTKAIKSHPLGYKVIDECFDDEGYTALHRAAQGGNVVAVKHFLEWGANLKIKTKDDLDVLMLAIWYAIKYRPYFNFHKKSLSTSLEIEFASFTASAILSHLTKDEPFHVGCNATRKVPTLLHLAATRGMWRFIDDLFVGRDRNKVTGLTANCPTKDNITPMYLAKLHGGDDCDWDNPWCKVVRVLLKNGASMIHPDPLTEYFLIFNFLFHEIPRELDLDFSKEERDILLVKDSKDVIGCRDLQETLERDVEVKRLISNLCSKADEELIENEVKIAEAISPLTKSEKNFACKKSSFQFFLKKELNKLKSSFSHLLRDVDDARIRCISPKNDQKPKEITDESNLSKSLEKLLAIIRNVKEHDEVPNENDNDEEIEFPPSLFSTQNLDMCSTKATIMILIIEEYLKVNHHVFIKYHRSLKKAIKQATPALRKTDHTQFHNVLIKKIFSYYARPVNCRLKETTYKYAYLKFLLHTIKFWNAQVQKMLFYPSISKFVSERLKNILLSGHSKEKMTYLMLRLSSEECSSHYKYLEMLRFTKPPMFDRTIKYS